MNHTVAHLSYSHTHYHFCSVIQQPKLTWIIQLHICHTHTCPSSWAIVKAALNPLSWTMEQLELLSHILPSSASPSVSHFLFSGVRQMFSLQTVYYVKSLPRYIIVTDIKNHNLPLLLWRYEISTLTTKGRIWAERVSTDSCWRYLGSKREEPR